MKPDTALDYAVFQLTPKRSRCELFVSSDGDTEKLASGLLKPFVTHLKVAEEQVARAVHSIKLEVDKRKNGETWFTKGTLERFVRFVSTPEVLEMVNTFDAEMSQLEAARKIYSQGTGDQLPGALGGDGAGTMAAADATKKELFRAIDVRLTAVRQDLTTACARASAAGFNPDTVSELQAFADRFGAHRLNEACSKFLSLCQRRPDLINHWKPRVNDQVVRSSWGSDMSIDDPTEEESGSHNIGRPHQLPPSQNKNQATGLELHQHRPDATENQQRADQLNSPTCHRPKSSFSAQEQQQRRAANEYTDVEKKKEEALNESSSSTQASQPSRRLSVQDRINLFENKQKESSGSGGKPIVVGKSAELRRLSSDVSSAPSAVEKAVLRRWSGASDMSIDLGNDKKDNNTDSPLCTPSASSVSQAKSNPFSGLSEDKDLKDHRGLSDTASSIKVEPKSDPGKIGISKNEEEVVLKGQSNWKDQPSSQIAQSRSFTSRKEQVDIGERGVSQEKLRGSLGGEERSIGFKDQVEGRLSGFPDRSEIALVRNQAASQTQIGTSAGREVDGASNGEFRNRVEDDEPRGNPVIQSCLKSSRSHFRSQSGQFDSVVEEKTKGVEQLASHPDQISFAGEVEETKNKDSTSSEKQQMKVEDIGVQRMKFQKPVSAGPELNKKSQSRRDESGYANKPIFSGKRNAENQETFGAISTAPVDQVQRVRQSKGNQELNDELKMKANELEKLFAEHKLRVPGDQSSSTRRSKPADSFIDQAANSQQRKQAAAAAAAEMAFEHLREKKTMIASTGRVNNMEKFSSTPPLQVVDSPDYGNTLRQDFSELGSDDSRGKFYERYMQKRDAKLREEWSSRRAEKEAKMKAMQDSLEWSRAEMKAKFSGSEDRKDSVSSARRRAEKLRSFNYRSNMKIEQHPISSIQSEGDEDVTEFSEQKYYGQDRSFNGTSFGDNVSRTSQTKKLLPNRNSSSSTPRTTAAPIPRSSAKVHNSSSGKRRVPTENFLAQSVPNFPDFKKENTKPSSGTSKLMTRSQVRNYARSKSTTEEVPLVKEEKPRRSQSLRKSSAGPAEYTDDGVILAPLTFDKEQTEQNLPEKFSKNVDSRPFLRKGNGIGPGAGASATKLKDSVPSESLRNEEEYDKLVFEAEDSVDMAKENEEEELETIVVGDSADICNEKPRLSQESDKSGNTVSENGDSLRSLSQVDPSSVAELPASVPSTFNPLGSLQGSPGESPVSWNARMHNPFSYPHETSDIDASVDSPIGSPASWNSHSLTQTDTDAARMRKKWGSTQKPFLVANSSHHQSRKDVTKGFKRLLKFGRRSRGTETLVDWISATTSEGDDDTEDGRDPANRSSEDLRKSRMGFSQGHPSDDGFNESDLLSEHVQALNSSIPAPPANFKLREDHISGTSIKAPRSFFSLSSFRSKGSDSKLR